MLTPETIYQRLPISLQHVAISLKGLDLRLRRASTKVMGQELERLRRRESWTAAQFLEYQRTQMISTVTRAYEEVPFYRNAWKALGITPADIQTLEDFTKLPILSKESVRQDPRAFVSEKIPSSKLQVGYTSGSTGKPMRYFLTRESFSRKWAFVARLRMWAGIENPLYPRRAQFTGRDVFGGATGAPTRINLPGNSLLLSTTHIREETVGSYLDAIRAWNPVLIDGYPSALRVLVRLARERRLEIPRIPVVITTAETLDDEARLEIEQGFQGKVFNQYSASEPSCFWSDCEAGNMHVHPESGISEIVRDDGTPAGPGEEGRILMTTFLNPAMPLIRYDIGDRAIVAKTSDCPCGRQMPVVERVVGRQDDILYVPGRGYIGRLDPVLKGLDGIIESQIVQESLDRIRVQIVPAESFSDLAKTMLERNLRSKVGEDVKISIELVRSIPRGANGKLRAVVTLVRDQYPSNVETPA